jgi:uncharacterized cupin superfamily protein
MTAAKLQESFVPFDNDGTPTGDIAYIHGGLSNVDAGVFRVSVGEFPDRVPVEHTFHTHEYFWVIEGTVSIEAYGEIINLTAGDCAYFPLGHQGMWTFQAPFKKFSIEITEGK